jgi:hypothetical protein
LAELRVTEAGLAYLNRDVLPGRKIATLKGVP